MRKISYLKALLAKHGNDIKEHLSLAVKKGQIRDSYCLPEPNQPGESLSQYAKRVMGESQTFQFVEVIFGGQSHYVAFGVAGPIIIPEGKFLLVPAQVVGGRWEVHYFLIYPDLRALKEKKNILIRIDSGCLSGQLFGDITCDCKEQLEIAKKLCIKNGAGIIINIPEHDGRGWGDYKLANQRLMNELGVDTVEAARLFYGSEGAIDQRTYTEAVLILRALGFNEQHSFCLATNSPRKVGAFHALGMKVSGTHSIAPRQPNEIVKKNLAAKSRAWMHNFNERISSLEE